MFLRFLFFCSEVVYSVSFAFLSFYCHSRFRFHPLLHFLLFRYCFLHQISYICLFLFSFSVEVLFFRFRHNRSCDKLQVRFLSRFLISNDFFLLLVFLVVWYIAYHIRAVFQIRLFLSFVIHILVDHVPVVVLIYPCT